MDTVFAPAAYTPTTRGMGPIEQPAGHLFRSAAPRSGDISDMPIDFFLADFDFGFVLISVDGRFDSKACAGGSSGDQIDDRLMTH